jgi:hypothetical protein
MNVRYNCRLMFWLDGGQSGKTLLQRATLTGNQQELLSGRLTHLTGAIQLDISRTDQRVYWLTDGATPRVGSCDYKGMNEAGTVLPVASKYSAIALYQVCSSNQPIISINQSSVSRVVKEDGPARKLE